MTNLRRAYSGAEHVALVAQVGSRCPECDKPLFYRKKGKQYRRYDLAHIFPLNPTESERIELHGVERLSVDVNDPDNIIPLCTGCHSDFDKPRTRDEYNKLLALKKQFIASAEQREIYRQYRLEDELARVVRALHGVEAASVPLADLQLAAKRLEDKFEPALPQPLRRKIHHAVADYYGFVRKQFRELELSQPTASELIFAQVRAFYLQQKRLRLPQATIFGHVVQWILGAVDSATTEAAEIVAAFFIQNCEVFE